MNSDDLLLDYNIFQENLKLFKLMSNVPIDDFSTALTLLSNPKYSTIALKRVKKYQTLLKNINETQMSKKDKENWSYYVLNSFSKLITCILYADKNPYCKQVNSLQLLHGKIGKVLFYPHYDSYMSILTILASNKVKLTVLMDKEFLPFWNDILSKNEFGKYIKLHGIQNSNSMIEILRDLKSGYNLVMYPDFTLGKKPQLTTTFLGKEAYVPTGPVSIAKKLKTDLIPLKMIYPKNQLLPYIILDKKIDLNQSTEVAAIEMMNNMESIISKDVSKWWGWEVYEEKILAL